MKYSSQNGSTLLVSLVVLTIITLVSVFSMKKSGLQSKMVGNTQFREMVFQTAFAETQSHYRTYESAASLELAQAIDAKLWDDVLQKNIQQPVVPAMNLTHKNYVNSNTALLFEGQKPVTLTGFSLNQFVSYGFQISTTASIPGANVTSTQEQGFSYVGPSGTN